MRDPNEPRLHAVKRGLAAAVARAREMPGVGVRPPAPAAADERELQEDRGLAVGYERGVAAERERCAKVVKRMKVRDDRPTNWQLGYADALEEAAAKIREGKP